MTEPFGRLRQFLTELKRRNVYGVAATCLVAAFVVLQLAGFVAGTLLRAPEARRRAQMLTGSFIEPDD